MISLTTSLTRILLPSSVSYSFHSSRSVRKSRSRPSTVSFPHCTLVRFATSFLSSPSLWATANQRLELPPLLRRERRLPLLDRLDPTETELGPKRLYSADSRLYLSQIDLLPAQHPLQLKF